MYNLIKKTLKLILHRSLFTAQEGIIPYTYREKIRTLVKQLERKRNTSDVEIISKKLALTKASKL